MLYQLSYASPTTPKTLPGIPGNGRAHSCSAHNTAQFLRLAHRKEGSKPTRTPGKAGVKMGDKLEAVRVTKEIKNPATGAVNPSAPCLWEQSRLLMWMTLPRSGHRFPARDSGRRSGEVRLRSSSTLTSSCIRTERPLLIHGLDPKTTKVVLSPMRWSHTDFLLTGIFRAGRK